MTAFFLETSEPVEKLCFEPKEALKSKAQGPLEKDHAAE